MTLQAAQILDDAFEVYKKVASQPDNSPLSQQSPSWECSKTPYDFAAEVCKSLLPHAYNYPREDTTRTEVIWDMIVEAMEVLPIDVVLSATNSRAYFNQPATTNRR